MKSLLKKADLAILVVIAAGSIAVAVAHFFHLLSPDIRYLPLFTLILLSLIGLHLIVEHYEVEDFRRETHETLATVARGVHTSEIRVFADSAEIEQYLGKRILEARRSVSDLSWKKSISAGFSAGDRQIAHTYMDRAISEASERITYREIFVFTDQRRKDKLQRRLAENKSGYSCRYFAEAASAIPRLQFVIVDDEEVVFAGSTTDAPQCAIRNPAVARVFAAFYQAAWEAATPIKEGSDVHASELVRIGVALKRDPNNNRGCWPFGSSGRVKKD